MGRVSVLLASSHMGLCQSLQQVLELEDWITVVGTSSSELDTLDLARALAPEVVILDYDLTGESLDIGRQILRTSPETKIIVLSLYDYLGQVTVKTAPEGQGFEVDSVEWLSKNSSAAELIKSVATVKKKRRLH